MSIKRKRDAGRLTALLPSPLSSAPLRVPPCVRSVRVLLYAFILDPPILLGVAVVQCTRTARFASPSSTRPERTSSMSR